MIQVLCEKDDTLARCDTVIQVLCEKDDTLARTDTGWGGVASIG